MPVNGPRLSRHRLSWIVGLFALIYLAAVLLVPTGCLRGLLPWFQHRYGLLVKVDQIDFNPLGPSLSVRDFALGSALEEPLLTGELLRLNLDVWSTLRHLKPTVGIRLETPRLTVAKDAEGRLNLESLRSLFTPASDKPWPLLLGGIALINGTVEFQDASNGDLKTRIFSPFNVLLSNFDPSSHGLTPFHVDLKSAQSDQGELVLNGRLAIQPFNLDATLSIQDLDLSIWSDLLTTGRAVRIQGGRVNTPDPISFSMNDRGLNTIQASSLELSDLTLFTGYGESKPWTIQKIRLDFLTPDHPGSEVHLGVLRVDRLLSDDLRFNALSINEIVFRSDTSNLFFDSFNVQELGFKGVNVKAIRSGSLDWNLQTDALVFDGFQVPDIEGQWGRLSGLELSDIRLNLDSESLSLKQLNLSKATTRWGELNQSKFNNLHLELAEDKITADDVRAKDLMWKKARFKDPQMEDVALSLHDLMLKGKNLRVSEVVHPKAKVLSLVATEANYDIPEGEIKALTLSSDALVAPQGHYGEAQVQEIAFKVPKKELAFAHGQMKHLSMGSMQASMVEINDLVAGLEHQSLSFRRGVINELLGSPSGAKGQAQAFVKDSSTLGHFLIEEFRADLDRKRLNIKRVASEESELNLKINAAGQLSVDELPPLRSVGASGAEKDSAWNIAINDMILGDYTIHFTDESTSPPVKLTFNGAAVQVVDFNNDHDEDFDFKLTSRLGYSGTLKTQGRVQLNPIRATMQFSMEKLRLKAVEPYWSPLTTIDVTNGRLNAWGSVLFRHDPNFHFDYEGTVSITGFDSKDKVEGKPFMKWDALTFDGLSVSNQPKRFVAKVITLDRPHAQVILNEQHDLNVANLIRAELPQQALAIDLGDLNVKQTPKGELPAFSVGIFRVRDGKLDYLDRSIKLGFSGDIEDLEGAATGLSSREGSTANVVMQGNMNTNTPVMIFGEVNPMGIEEHSDIKIDIKGFNLTSLSNYVGEFGGYRIDKGKIDLGIHYQMERHDLVMNNRYVLDNLTLGDQVDSTKDSWLLDFAIAILKDDQGFIDVDLPVSGSLSNPEFSMWHLYENVFEKLMAKFLWSPITLIESPLALVDETQYPINRPLADIHFAPGHVEVDIMAKAQLQKVVKELIETPRASLDIESTMAPHLDKLAIAETELLEQLKLDRRQELRSQGVRLYGQPISEITDADYHRLVTAFFRRHYPDAPELEGFAKSGRNTLDGPLYEAAKAKVLEDWPVPEIEIHQLGQFRAQNIRKCLIKELGLPDQRIYLKTPRMLDLEDTAIKTHLTLYRN